MSSRSSLHRTLTAHAKKAVIFDRNETMMLILKFLLIKLGFSVSMASSVESGMQLIHTQKPELVVWELDRQPEVDFQMLQEIQTLNLKRPYVILVSTPETLSDDAPIEALGTGDVFIKPFEPVQLIRRIEWLVNHEKIQ